MGKGLLKEKGRWESETIDGAKRDKDTQTDNVYGVYAP